MSKTAKEYSEVVYWLMIELGLTIDVNNPIFALQLYEQVPDSSDAHLMSQLCSLQALLRRGSYKELQSKAQDFLDTQELPSSYETRLLHIIGAADWLMGDAKRALHYFEKARIKNYQAGDKMFEATLNMGLGIGYRAQGDEDKALSYLQLAHDAHVESNSVFGVAQTLANFAIIHLESEELDKARELCLESKDLFYEIGNFNGASYQYGTLGDIYASQGNYSEALRAYSKSYKLLVQTSDKRGEARLLSVIGSCRAKVALEIGGGKYEIKKALETLVRSHNSFDELELRQLFRTEAWIALCYDRLGDSSSAYDYAKKATATAEQNGVTPENCSGVFSEALVDVQRIIAEHE